MILKSQLNFYQFSRGSWIYQAWYVRLKFLKHENRLLWNQVLFLFFSNSDSLGKQSPFLLWYLLKLSLADWSRFWTSVWWCDLCKVFGEWSTNIKPKVIAQSRGLTQTSELQDLIQNAEATEVEEGIYIVVHLKLFKRNLCIHDKHSFIHIYRV